MRNRRAREDDPFYHSLFRRQHADTRTTEQKLAAMARDPGASEGERTNAAHLLFKRRQKAAAPSSSGDHSARYDAGDPMCVSGMCGHKRSDGTTPTNDMSHDDFMQWMKHKTENVPEYKEGAHHQPGTVRPSKPHIYQAYGGSDAMGCRSCGKSKGNKSANHTAAFTAKFPPGFHGSS